MKTTHSKPIPLTEQERKRLEQMAALLDTKFKIPGTDIRFGMDSAIGLIPGVGDAATAGFSFYPVYIATSHRFSLWLRIKMVYRICVDFLIGLVPLFGDAFDVWYKCTKRNVEDLLQADAAAFPPPKP
jgi:hypothetical protein